MENGSWNTENYIPKRQAYSFQSVLCDQTFKALLVAGLCYYTYQEGLWSDAFKSSCFLGKFIESCPKEEDDSYDNEFASLDSIQFDDPEACLPFIPRAGYVLYRLGHIWNQIVIYTFWFVLDGPSELLQALYDLNKPKPKPKIVQCPP